MSASPGRRRAAGNLYDREPNEAASAAPAARRVCAVVLMSGALVSSMGITAGAAEAPSSVVDSRTVTAPSTPSPDVFGLVGFTTKVASPAPAPEPEAPRAARAAARPATPAPAAPRAAPAARPAPAPAPRAVAAAAPAAPPAPRAAPAARPAAAAAPAPSVPSTGGISGIARGLSGIPYVYGGSSAGGFDCSGFTSYVYRLAGKSIPRTAEAQRAAAVKVSTPQPGDLVFFGSPAYHVGIYAGGGMMYDAQRPGTTTGLHSIWTQTNVSYGRF